MTQLTLWTWIAIGILVTLPLIVFVLFVRDAWRLLREMHRVSNRAEGHHPP